MKRKTTKKRKYKVATSGKNAGYVRLKSGKLKSKATGKVYKKGTTLASRKKALRAAYANGWKGPKK